MSDWMERFDPYRYMIPYEEQLKDPKWKSKADQVKKASGYRCSECGSKQGLQVHHKDYRKDCWPWEYSIDQLRCLCDVCHKRAHTRTEEPKEPF